MPLTPSAGIELNRLFAGSFNSLVVAASAIVTLSGPVWTPAAEVQSSATNTHGTQAIGPGFTNSNQILDASAVRTFEQARRTFQNFKVESVEEFGKMARHHERLLAEGRITHEFRTANGQLIHCLEIGSQDSVKRAGIDPRSVPSGPAIPPGGGQSAPNQDLATPADFGMDGSLDDEGNARSCPWGSVPILIPSLEDLCRFRKLEDRFQKYPPGNHAGSGGRSNHGRARPPPGGQRLELPTGHEYAYVFTEIDNQGEQADFNLWQPTVARDDEFSLSQLWAFRGDGADLQTAETGWQVYPLFYGDSLPHLFIFSTQNGYSPPNPGYYNLEPGSPFVQTDASVIIGGPLAPVSVYAGTQYDVTLMFYRDQGGAHDWWLKYGTKWIGYYPNGWFSSAGLADKSEGVEFGGEIVNNQTDGVHTTTDMGSGHFPSEGLQRSAYIKRIKFVDMNNNSQNADTLVTGVSDASYYDIALFSSADTNWLDYFYFGGPGRVPLPNDGCTGVVALAEGIAYTESTAGATDDTLPDNGVITKGIWFTYTPSQTGLATVDTCLSDFDTVIEVFSGACGTLTFIAFNDNNGPLCAGSQASVSFNSIAGTTYYICAGSFGGASGNLQIRAGIHRPVIDAQLAGAATGNVQIAWSSLSGVNYQVQFKTNLNDPTWRVLSNLQATGNLTTIQDPAMPRPARRFYRVMVQ